MGGGRRRKSVIRTHWSGPSGGWTVYIGVCEEWRKGWRRKVGFCGEGLFGKISCSSVIGRPGVADGGSWMTIKVVSGVNLYTWGQRVLFVSTSACNQRARDLERMLLYLFVQFVRFHSFYPLGRHHDEHRWTEVYGALPTTNWCCHRWNCVLIRRLFKIRWSGMPWIAVSSTWIWKYLAKD